jgi:hypothetical protein
MKMADAGRLTLSDVTGVAVARLSRKAEAEWRPRLGAIHEIRVVAMIQRSQIQEKETSRDCRVEDWEIPIVEIVWNCEQRRTR